MLLGGILAVFLSLAVPESNHQWLNERLKQHDLQIAEFQDTGRGLKTLRDRKAGDLILAVPSCYALSAQRVLNRYAHIKDAVQKAFDSNIPLNESQIMALGVLQLKEENDPCVCTLPAKQYSVSLMPDKIKSCLPPTYKRSVDRIRKYNEELYNTGYSSSGATRPTLEGFLWAIASTQSRTFTADDQQPENQSFRIMLPGIDLINHRHGNEADLRYNPEERQYEFRSRVPFLAGEEVSFSYGNEGNMAFLQNFGFCIRGNPQRIISFDLDDILLAVQSIIPNIFPDPIINMFKAQSKEQGNHPSLLDYDGTERAPRASLKDSLLTVQELGERLAEMSLKGLDSEIMRKLLVRRKEELDTSIQRIKKVRVEDDWQPFLSSVHTLLHDEMQALSGEATI